MPKQKKINRTADFVSKRSHAAQLRHKKTRNLIIILSSVIIVAVLGVVGWSIWNFQVKPYDQTVLTFNGESFNMRYFINTMKIYYGKAPSTMTIAGFADYTAQQIEHDQTIIQGAKLLGVSIPRSQIEKQLKDAGVPVTREAVDVAMAQQIMAQQVPSKQPQYDVNVMLLESQAAAQAAIAKVKAGEPFTTVANETSRLPQGTVVEGFLGWVTPREADLTLGSTTFGSLLPSAANGTLNGPTYDAGVMKQYGYWVAEAIAQKNVFDSTSNTTVDQMHLNGILVGTLQEANDAIDKLKAGANITELAKQVSQSPNVSDVGADIGWIMKGQDPGGFGQVFNLPLKTPIGPISENSTQTKGNYWVYQITNKDPNRALSNDQQTTLQNDFVTKCTNALKKDSDYKEQNLLTQKTTDFALNQVVSSLGKGAILIGSDSLPDAEVGIPYSYQLKDYGDTQGAVWSLTKGTLPKGIVMNTATGLISGTPVLAGGSGFTVQVQSKYHHDTKDLVMEIHLAIKITTSSLPNAQVGTDYTQALAVQTDSDNYTWSIPSGNLPDGLQLLSGSGTISGTPTKTGTYDFTAKVTDGLGVSTRKLSITVDSANVTSSGNETSSGNLTP